MKKRFLLLIMVVASVTLNAQVFTENFETAPIGGDVEGYNDWYVSFKSADANGVSPKIEEGALFYEGYAGSDIGNVAVLDSLMGEEDATKRISTRVVTFGEGDTLRPVIGGKMYAAFIVSILPDSRTSYRDFFTWEGSSGSSWTRGRVFAKVNDDNTELQFAVSKNSSGDVTESEVIVGGVEAYHLLVLSYEAVDGDKNDVVSLYINPDPTKSEAEQTNVLVNIDEQSDYSEGTEIKINLRQRAIGAFIGGIRVGRDWSQVLQGGATAINDLSASNISSIRSFRNTIITSGSGSVHVYDLTGRKVLSKTTSGRIQAPLKNGIYLVRFEDNNGNVASGKVVLNQQ